MIRKARTKDAKEIIELVKQVITEVDFFPSNAIEFNYTVEQEEEFIENIELFLVIEVDGKLVGSSTLMRGSYEKTKHTASFGITILKAYSGKGYGSKIIEEVISHAKISGIEKIELEVLEHNDRAIKLYKKYGFIEEGIKRKAIQKDGIYHDIVLMAKFL